MWVMGMVIVARREIKKLFCLRKLRKVKNKGSKYGVISNDVQTKPDFGKYNFGI